VFYKLHFTNLSSHPCTLRGFAGVSAIDLGGHQLGRAASRDRAHAPRLVTLAAGSTATANLRIVNVDNFPAGRCHRTTAAGLRVYPPGNLASKTIPFPFAACSRRGPVYLSTQAVARS